MSNRITKSEAIKIAELMVNYTINKKISSLKEEMSILMTPVVIEKIPTEVMKCFESFPNHFKTNSSVKAVFNGGGSEHVILSNSYPCTGGWGDCYETPKDIYDKLVRLSNKRSKLKEESYKLKNDIQSTLISLATYKKIKDQFPEAFAYIPAEWLSESFTTLALPIEELIKELNKYK
jgi:hypothetical protein